MEGTWAIVIETIGMVGSARRSGGARHRPSAPKRIGCPYRLVAFSAAPSFDAAAWLPGEVMARFSRAA
jgi:hypothetical protein